MKHATMKPFYTLILFLFASTAYGQSNVEKCITKLVGLGYDWSIK